MNDNVGQLDVTDSVDFEQFYRASFAKAVRLAHLLVGSNHAADDIAQDALLRVGPKLAELRDPDAYLNTTVVNLSRNWHRSQRRRAARERGDLRIVAVATDGPEADDRHEQLLTLVDRLPFRQRTVLVARYWLDLTEIEIAELVGCRPGTVKSLSSRALNALRKDLP